MVVNLNPGGIAGGSGAQYFVGDFDGTTFTSDDTAVHPAGRPDLGRLRGGTSAPGRPPGTAFGNGPAAGNAARPGRRHRLPRPAAWPTASTTGGDAGTGHADLAGLHDQPATT